MKKSKILFFINPDAGKTFFDWRPAILLFFAEKNFEICLITLKKRIFKLTYLNTEIEKFEPEILVANGGDGTVKLVAEAAFNKHLKFGILPSGSANGLARELGIGSNQQNALEILVKGNSRKIHLTLINKQICVHLSDIGLNAYAMKKFKFGNIRGLLGYLLVFLKVLKKNPVMEIEMKINSEITKIKAEMVVIANGTCYGNGAVINPLGNLSDNFFEITVVKEISFHEVFKMIFSHAFFDVNKTQVFQTKGFSMHSTKKVHFQIDGEYLGKTNFVHAELIPSALEVLVP